MGIRTSPSETKTRTLQDAAVANGDGTAVDVGNASEGGYVTLGIHIQGTGFTGTINFEGTIDDANWFAVEAVSMADSATTATTATAAGAYRVNTLGLSKFRARISGYSGSNPITVIAKAFS